MIRKSCITSHPVSAGCYKRKRFKLFSSTFFTTLGVEFLTSCDVVILNKKMAAIFTKMDEKWWRIFKETLNEKWWMMCSLRKGKWKWIGLFFSWEKEKKLKKKMFLWLRKRFGSPDLHFLFFLSVFLKGKSTMFSEMKITFVWQLLCVFVLYGTLGFLLLLFLVRLPVSLCSSGRFETSVFQSSGESSVHFYKSWFPLLRWSRADTQVHFSNLEALGLRLRIFQKFRTKKKLFLR